MTRSEPAPSKPAGRAAVALRELMHALPLPLAQLIRRIFNGKSPADRHTSAFYLAECALKLAAAARVGVYVDRALKPGSALAQRMLVLALPSLGHWCELLRETSSALAALPDAALIPLGETGRELAKNRPDWTGVRAFGARCEAEGIISPDIIKQANKRGVLGFFDLLVAYRNEVVGHGAQRSPAFYEDLGELLQAALVEVLASPALFGGLSLAQARLAIAEDGAETRAFFYGLTGLAGMPLDEDATGATPGQLYFIGGGARVPLHPLAVYKHDEELEREQVGFLNRTTRRTRKVEGGSIEEIRRVDYLDYSSGQTIEGADAKTSLAAFFAKLLGKDQSASDVDAAAAARDTSESGSPEPEEEAVPAASVIGDFELLGELGRGSMGVVYKARQRSLRRVVALKVLPPINAADPVARKRFQKEIAALGRCDHPNVVKILASGEDGDRAYYAMDYVSGSDLSQLERRLPEDSLTELFADAADGLAHIHSNGILHRDLKPGNLMLTADGKRIVIMDLGLARLRDESRALTSSDVKILGTLRYMAPEQLQRRLVEVDERADIYGLGAALYECATGKPIFDGDTEQRLIQQVLNEDPRPPRAINPAISADLSTVILTALNKSPARRYPTARALADDLRAVAAKRPIWAKRPGPIHRALLWTRRNRPLAALIGVLTLAALGGAVFVERTRARTLYYSNQTTVRGVFQGVGEVRSPSGRRDTFRTTLRGGRVLTVEYVNGRGILKDTVSFASARFGYADDGSVTERVDQNKNGQVVARHIYSWKDGVLSDLRLDRSNFPAPDDDDVAMYRFELDARGFPARVLFFNDRGSPRPRLGVYGYTVVSDERGLPVENIFLSRDGRPAVRRDGVARATMKYDDHGDLIEQAFFDASGAPTLRDAGFARTVDTYDDRGNVIGRAYFGKDGAPILQKDGLATWRLRYNEDGDLIERSAFGVDGRPVALTIGFSSYRSRYDARGNEIERAHFDVNGAPVQIREGFAIYRARFDERDREIERSFFGPDGAPALNKGGYASLKTRYDDRGNVVETSSYGVDGSPILLKEGRASVRFRYDDRDNEIERAFFGVGGERVVSKDGCAVIRVARNDRGRESERACLDESDKPRLGKEGYATMRVAFDERGRAVEYKYFGASGEPVAIEEGYAQKRLTLDDVGNEVAAAFFGPDGAPAARKDGAVRWTARYDEIGKLIERRLFDKEGNEIKEPNKAAAAPQGP